MNAIASLGSALSNIDYSSRQGFAVAKITLDQAKVDGEAAVELIRSASEVATKQKGAPDPSGCRGCSVDTYA